MTGDSRFVPAREGRFEIREQASRFFGFARRMQSEAQAGEFLRSLKREFHDATHICFAWKIGASTRAADAGEPSGTAGRPILASIDAVEMDEVCVAVVRYYGGTKLGTGGLARCYRSAAAGALADAGRQLILEAEEFEADAPYERVSFLKRLVDPPDIELASEQFGGRAAFRFRVRHSRAEAFAETLTQARIPFRRFRPAGRT